MSHKIDWTTLYSSTTVAADIISVNENSAVQNCRAHKFGPLVILDLNLRNQKIGTEAGTDVVLGTLTQKYRPLNSIATDCFLNYGWGIARNVGFLSISTNGQVSVKKDTTQTQQSWDAVFNIAYIAQDY